MCAGRGAEEHLLTMLMAATACSSHQTQYESCFHRHLVLTSQNKATVGGC